MDMNIIPKLMALGYVQRQKKHRQPNHAVKRFEDLFHFLGVLFTVVIPTRITVENLNIAANSMIQGMGMM